MKTNLHHVLGSLNKNKMQYVDLVTIIVNACSSLCEYNVLRSVDRVSLLSNCFPFYCTRRQE